MNEKLEKHVAIELVISEILRWGVRISLGLIVVGTILCFVHSGDYGARGGTAEDLRSLLAGGSTFPRTLAWLGSGLVHLRGAAIVVAGLALLIATPVIRVAATVVAFAIEKDRMYFYITLAVFLGVVLSFFLGAVG
jgi:uncharacterized membrane protein